MISFMFIKQDLETNYTNIILKVLKASLGVRIKLTPSRFDGSLSLLNMKCSLISWASQISLHLPEKINLNKDGNGHTYPPKDGN